MSPNIPHLPVEILEKVILELVLLPLLVTERLPADRHNSLVSKIWANLYKIFSTKTTLNIHIASPTEIECFLDKLYVEHDNTAKEGPLFDLKPLHYPFFTFPETITITLSAPSAHQRRSTPNKSCQPLTLEPYVALLLAAMRVDPSRPAALAVRNINRLIFEFVDVACEGQVCRSMIWTSLFPASIKHVEVHLLSTDATRNRGEQTRCAACKLHPFNPFCACKHLQKAASEQQLMGSIGMGMQQVWSGDCCHNGICSRSVRELVLGGGIGEESEGKLRAAFPIAAVQRVP
ncbi:hypothetical protein R3P38DRAFT_792743 [Favolaschia claudopus]|uniref:F-box domain-containing protein n=1 Tax=Favolaschia claudopus TaxID=2862362 RepID=A0AAW0C1W8_9AGAR